MKVMPVANSAAAVRMKTALVIKNPLLICVPKICDPIVSSHAHSIAGGRANFRK
jgi:uncharacterized membrane protein